MGPTRLLGKGVRNVMPLSSFWGARRGDAYRTSSSMSDEFSAAFTLPWARLPAYLRPRMMDAKMPYPTPATGHTIHVDCHCMVTRLTSR